MDRENSRPGCLAWIGVATVLLVVMVVGILKIVALANGGRDDTTGGTAPASGVASNSTNTDHPPQDDVTITGCVADASTNSPKAVGQIVNHSSEASKYAIHVEFVQRGVRLDEGFASAERVAPGQTALWEAVALTERATAVECKLIEVNRYAS